MNDPNPYASPAVREVGPALELAPPQEVRCQLTEEDFIAAMQFNAIHVPEVAATHRTRRAWYLLLGLGFGLFALTLLTTDDLELAAIVFAGLAVRFFYKGLAHKTTVRRNVAAQAKLMVRSGVVVIDQQPVRCLVDDDFITIEEPMLKSQIGWGKVVRVAQTKDHLLIFYQPHSPIILPRRSFSSEERFEGFCRLVKSLWKDSNEPGQR